MWARTVSAVIASQSMQPVNGRVNPDRPAPQFPTAPATCCAPRPLVMGQLLIMRRHKGGKQAPPMATAPAACCTPRLLVMGTVPRDSHTYG